PIAQLLAEECPDLLAERLRLGGEVVKLEVKRRHASRTSPACAARRRRRAPRADAPTRSLHAGRPLASPARADGPPPPARPGNRSPPGKPPRRAAPGTCPPPWWDRSAPGTRCGHVPAA